MFRLKYSYASPKDRALACLRAALVYGLLALWACTTIVPLLWVLLNSFKPSDDILRNSVALPARWVFDNYKTMTSYPDVNLLVAFRNSAIISGSVVAGVVVFSSFAAFALGRFATGFARYIDALLSACLLVPAFSTLIPNFVLISALPIRGTYYSVILPQIAGNMCFSTLLLTGYVRSLPKELDEAAVIDGASVMQIFWRIIWPLTVPMISTVGVMVFIWSYNDLLTSLVYLPTRNLQPVSVILSLVSNMFGTDYGAMMAAIVITIFPLMLLYAVAQEQVVKGLTVGAVKG
ncbi:MAG: carbohydrate ABC transporter permease [Clostridiales bacterium]|jgi:raffinose/stachyose/melibiose transport system permease protein|nr:carbohydrate ABC transporter permease [Clostridiales bacterium]